jgi:hypothetical protein
MSRSCPDRKRFEKKKKGEECCLDGFPLLLHPRPDYANERPPPESSSHALQELFRGLLEGRL